MAHHAVVSAWRERERRLRALGWNVELFSARRWNEGGRTLDLRPEQDAFVHGVGTLGRHPIAFLYDPRPLWRALRAGPDLIDLHEEPYALATAEVLLLRALQRSEVPYVLYSAQNIEKRYPPPFRWFEAYALRHAAAAYVVNTEAGEILRRKGLAGPAALIPLGVDLDDFRPAGRSAPRTPPVVGYVGRLEAHKGVDTLLRAAAERPGWRLRVSGDGVERSALEALARELGLGERVEFQGFASGSELSARYRDLDVLVVPSLPTPSWLEQFGRVAVEAMASGVPVVASRTGALPDVVADAGVLVEPGDAGELARAVDRVLEPAEWSRLRDAGLARAQEYTWERVARSHGALYERGLEATGSGAARPPQVVVVAYGSPALLRGALDALGEGFGVTIVDNSSSPETRALAEERGARYIDPGSNLGFGAGVNEALRSLRARGLAEDDVLLLNPDARIAGREVARMQRLLHSDRRLGVVGATQVEPDTGAEVRVWWPAPTPLRAWVEAAGLGGLNRAHDFAIGSILLLRAETVADVGGFDERFFLYAEETDWQKRAKDAGWRIAVAEVDASHIGGATSSDSTRRDLLFYVSLERYQRKHFGALGWQIFRAAMVAGAAMRSVVLTGAPRTAAVARMRMFLQGPVARLRAAEARERRDAEATG